MLYRDYRLHTLEEKIRRETALDLRLAFDGDRRIVSGTVPDLRRYDEVRSVLDRLFPGGYVERLNVPLRVLKSLHAELSDSVRKNGEKFFALEQELRRLDSETAKERQEREKMRGELGVLRESLDHLRHTLRDTKRRLRSQQERLERAKQIAEIRTEILRRLRRVFGKDPRYRSENGTFDFSGNGLFDAGKEEPRAQALGEIKKVFEKYITILLADPEIRPYIASIVINGYTDSKGSKEMNLRLSSARAERVKAYLSTLPLAKKLGADRIMISRGMGPKDPVIVDGREDPEASRRIKIGFRLDKRAILKSLQDSFK